MREYKYATVEDIPPNEPISLTEVAPRSGRWDYSDFGSEAYCSICGKGSQRRARADLWAVRNQTRPEYPGPVWTYCIEHLPAREWARGDDVRGSHVREISCPRCGLLVPIGSMCDDGAPHEAP